MDAVVVVICNVDVSKMIHRDTHRVVQVRVRSKDSVLGKSAVSPVVPAGYSFTLCVASTTKISLVSSTAIPIGLVKQVPFVVEHLVEAVIVVSGRRLPNLPAARAENFVGRVREAFQFVVGVCEISVLNFLPGQRLSINSKTYLACDSLGLSTLFGRIGGHNGQPDRLDLVESGAGGE